MSESEKKVAESLLKIKAIKLQPSEPFTWASGWKSPIYCDNRKTLSFPEIRTLVRDEFVKTVKAKYPQAEVIAGVATGAIAQGALVAQELGLPFIYVRSSPKDHGLGNLIEGDLKAGQKVVVIEDLISTGGSSLKAAEAVRAAGAEVLGMVAIFTYGFPVSENAFKEHKVELTTLSNYNAMIETAVATGYVKEEQVETLKEWRKSPDTWGK
ncbi:MAG: orotate phosphoribosyltransferase [Paludibacteraceae bacterium]|jgi:orotate phosphoribosyltransferase|nr:orotate phosphoribosyltransferase [Paludibacteraceae bacterium]MBQ2590516.1 orotate phosphoribosyltransferase [Paludibacteraceae bacterium]MBQ6962274.1 orotate phosphoribosyltransferase [Paludibacteraceae bacterium]MBR0497829.1 orotate phosphoribosyltransferase [Paludibacteraceae bacterium]MCM8871755.1 orotate phosphoribosyltransferase [Paludibacteraceae bacterium]